MSKPFADGLPGLITPAWARHDETATATATATSKISATPNDVALDEAALTCRGGWSSATARMFWPAFPPE
ncbi:hypothetical protein [Lentzea atacamensis]|uniref:hypothetical protein n=1 Tax=Lentzea atacamensis TaxID=531938 RepID=UPI000D6AA7F2|nr:hypothetical protein [Lentzea atacamensis]